jgi:hypothetical protein
VRVRRRQNFRRIWFKACKAAGISGVVFHDLRHTGNTLAAASGANLRERMERMGHSSTRAAVMYLHAANDCNRVIADAMNTHIAATTSRTETSHDAPPRALLARGWHAGRHAAEILSIRASGDEGT